MITEYQRLKAQELRERLLSDPRKPLTKWQDHELLDCLLLSGFTLAGPKL